MVQDSQVAALREQIDHVLSSLLAYWQDVPAIEVCWHTEFDAVQKEVYRLESAIPHDQLARLQRWAADGLLSPEQRARYDELLALIQRMQPILDRLFAES